MRFRGLLASSVLDSKTHSLPFIAGVSAFSFTPHSEHFVSNRSTSTALAIL